MFFLFLFSFFERVRGVRCTMKWTKDEENTKTKKNIFQQNGEEIWRY